MLHLTHLEFLWTGYLITMQHSSSVLRHWEAAFCRKAHATYAGHTTCARKFELYKEHANERNQQRKVRAGRCSEAGEETGLAPQGARGGYSGRGRLDRRGRRGLGGTPARHAHVAARARRPEGPARADRLARRRRRGNDGGQAFVQQAQGTSTSFSAGSHAAPFAVSQGSDPDSKEV